MNDGAQKVIEKLFFIFRKLDVCHLLLNEPFGDDAHRCIFRFAFIQIDNFLKLAGRAKNLLVKENLLSAAVRGEIEASIASMSAEYEAWYAQIRDKISAHNQPVPLEHLLALWSSIDYSALQLLLGEIKHIDTLFSSAMGMNNANGISDYSPLNVGNYKRLAPPTGMRVSNDRLALAKPGAVAMISLNSSIEATQTVTSIIDFLEVDFALTAATNNPTTHYHREVFDIGWLLAIIDICSLVDNLFESDSYSTSLTSQWGQVGIKGTSSLSALNAQRDHAFEAQLRRTRNSLAAHIDDTIPITDLVSEFEAIDLRATHTYAHFLVRGFHDACRIDIRTRIFSRNNVEFPDTKVAGYSSKAFTDF